MKAPARTEQTGDGLVQGLGLAVVLLLALQMVLIAAEIVSRFYQVDLLHQLQHQVDVSGARLDAATNVVNRTAFVGGIAFLATIVVWCVWQHRAQGNAIRLGVGDLRFTPGWAVGWWFIPIANFWKPFQAVRELWKASHGPGWRSIGTWVVLGWWWATWLLGSLDVRWDSTTRIGVYFGSKQLPPGLNISDMIAEDRWRALWMAARLVAAVLAILIVRSVNRLQARAEAAAAEARTAIPPAPVGIDGDAGLAMPAPPAVTPTVTDALSRWERALLVGVVVATIALWIGGMVWSNRARALPASDRFGAVPSASVRFG